jgi:2-iminobutanoate/2-iminopropanoate deaminase
MSNNNIRKVVASPDAPPAVGPYSQGIHTGNFIYLAGQIPLVRDSGRLAEGGITAQTEQVITNIKALLASEGLDLGAVVKTTVFLANMNDFAAMNAVYSKHFANPFPARSTIQVARIPKDALVEIEVTAVAA